MNLDKNLVALGGDVVHHFSDGLYAKEFFVPRDTAMMKRTHDFSHLSILAKGRAAVMKGDSIEIIEAPACIEIKSGLVHGVKAIDDCVWFCIHATDERDPDTADALLVKGK